jgi:small subunit ribosomal protein S16
LGSGQPLHRLRPFQNDERLIFRGGFVSVKIRLKRIGSKKKPAYRIVVLDSTMSGKGRRVQDLGTYNPRAKEENQVLNLNKESILEWVKKGAIPSDTVQGILKKAGVSV